MNPNPMGRLTTRPAPPPAAGAAEAGARPSLRAALGQAVQPGEKDLESFKERGVILPFTTPQLLAARLRQGAMPGALEVVLPHLGGRPGPVVTAWSSLPATYPLTLHDHAFWHCLKNTTQVTPALIRSIALKLGKEGWSGRAAMVMAAEAEQAEATAHRRLFFLLLADLINRTELPAENKVPPQQESLAYLRPRIGKAVARLARRFDVKTETIEASVEALAGCFMHLGKADDAVSGHRRTALGELHGFVKELETWLAPRRGTPLSARADFILRRAQLSLHCAQAAIAELDRVMADCTLLIRAWQRDAPSVQRRAARPDWLLDGWDIISNLWRNAEPGDREAVLWEMASLTPPLPKEIEGWAGFPEAASHLRRATPPVGFATDWRGQRRAEFVMRNEALFSGQHAVTLGSEAKKLREMDRIQSARALTVQTGGSKNSEDPLTSLSNRTSRASDEVLRQVVGLLEAIPARSTLDPILESARPRLRLLRPPRPITFARILFLPFDGNIVPVKDWRPGMAKLPRQALLPIANALREAMGPAAEELTAPLGGRNFFDVLQVDVTGRALWAAAAEHAETLPLDNGLPSVGLTGAHFQEILARAAGIWRHADALWEARLAAFSGPPAELVTQALQGLAKEGQEFFSMGLINLLQDAASPGSVFAAAARLSPIAGTVADEKMEERLRHGPPPLPIEDPVRAAHEAEECVTLIREVEAAAAGRHRDRRPLLAPLVKQMDQACQEALSAIVEKQFLPALRDPNAKRRPAIILNLEVLARALKRLEAAGRRCGNPEFYDDLQRRYANTLKALVNGLDGGGLLQTDIFRLMEILLGTETALAMGAANTGSLAQPNA